MIRPVILCGGSGTRLWPLSRKFHPKQFIELASGTLFGQTVQRAAGLPGAGKPLVICNEHHRFFAAGILHDLGIAAEILLEPQARNTAPAIALAALAACDSGEDPLLLVLPSDHVIQPDAALHQATAAASAAAENGSLVTFGVTPTRPETGYGYIRRGAAAAPGVFRVDRFVEKPAHAEAERLLTDGNFTWNSGIFLFRASVYLEELARFAPVIHAACETAWAARTRDLDFIRVEPRPLPLPRRIPSITPSWSIRSGRVSCRLRPTGTTWARGKPSTRWPRKTRTATPWWATWWPWTPSAATCIPRSAWWRPWA